MVETADPAQDRTKFDQFAVVNGSELLERLAYYGVLSVTALYLVQQGYSNAAIGGLFAVLLPLPYIVPLVAGPLAARFGYKPIMLAAFIAYAGGFLLIFVSPALLFVLGGIILIGVGAGLFKPLTAAAIGLVTSAKHRSLGYSIYYVGINVGGFVGPILIASLGAYRLAYLVGAITIGVNALVVMLLFSNPLDPKPGLQVAAAFRPFLEVARNTRFLVLLAIFSGFWMLYSMNFTFVILYLQAFVERPEWFKPGLQVSLQSLCVIALGVPLGAVASRMEAVNAMSLGIALLVAGFLVVGFFPVFALFIVGIVLVAAGEVLAYPGFLSYVSRIAPPDRIAVYQGVGFLPLFVGFTVGPVLGGQLYGPLADAGGRPPVFWAVMSCVGLLALALLLLYARAIRPTGVGAPRAPRWQGIPGAVAVALIGVIAVVAAFATEAQVELAPAGDDVEPLAAGTVVARHDGSTVEGATTEQAVTIPVGVHNVTFTLEWSDEAANSPLPGATNQPDNFEIEVLDRFGTRLGEDSGAQGALAVGASFSGATDVMVRITLTSAGDTVVLGQTAAADTSNDWSLVVTVS